MKLSVVGLFAAGAVAILFQTGTTAQLSGAQAAESCIKSNVMLHIKPCHGTSDQASTTPAAEPTVTPTAGPPESCIKTNVTLHVKRCPAGV